MPLFSLDIEKMKGGRYWTNRYILAAENLTGAIAIAAQIPPLERAVHMPSVTLTKYRVSDMIPLTDSYIVTPLNQAGQSSAGGDEWPLFNVVRCDFGTALGGRPSRKFIRAPVTEGVTGPDGALLASFITYFMTEYVTPLVNLSGYVDVDEQQITQGSVYPFVGMRQLRRGSKKKDTPVLP